jgi:tetratricopeptide (TPR) repeat protein
MTNDPYSSCPCGSGKKFKWCCQPIDEQIASIYAMNEQGQHEAALRAMDDLVTQHASNPQAWGRKALLLYQNGKVDDAEAALTKAFELFPTYPFGFFLKGHFRANEGEVAGALLLFRKAAENYDPSATDMLADIHLQIYDCEMKLNHPIAARAAAELAMRFAPGNDNLRQGLRKVFSNENPNLPASAYKPYSFKPLPASTSPERKAAWEQALKTAGTPKLSDAVKAFEQLTQGDAVEPAAWYNLGLSQAWLGNNQAAVAALDQYVSAETDETQATEAWTLAEILCFGQGMEDQADLVQHSIVFGVRDPQAFVQELGELEKAGLLAGAQVNEEQGVLHATILEPPGPALTPELEAKQNLKPAAYATLMGNLVHLHHVVREPLDAVFQNLQQKLGNLIAQPQSMRGPAKFSDALTEAIGIPRRAATQEEAHQRVREGFEKFFEEVWLQRPLKSIGNVPPVDAAGSNVLRKKLRGALQLLRDCCDMTRAPYDFNRLYRKLGLLEGVAAPAADGAAKPDIAAMSAADLAGLKTDDLSTADLDTAYQTAMKLDAKDIAGKFAAQLVERPAYPERPDRYPLFKLLIDQSQAQGNLDAALDHLNAGEADDCKNNEGKRRNEYELRRAQLHAKRNEFDDAERVYDGLIARLPAELNYRVNAAETMLSGRQSAKALKYAKEGMAAAQKAKSRDLEGHFKELMAAAQK